MQVLKCMREGEKLTDVATDKLQQPKNSGALLDYKTYRQTGRYKCNSCMLL